MFMGKEIYVERFLEIEGKYIKLIYRAGNGKGKAVPLQACSGPEGSTKLRFPDYVTMVQDGGKVFSLTHRPPLPPKTGWQVVRP